MYSDKAIKQLGQFTYIEPINYSNISDEAIKQLGQLSRYAMPNKLILRALKMKKKCRHGSN